MTIDVTLPQLGESVTEGTVSKWLVREGDMVAKDQALLEVSTDKADTEVFAPSAGRIVKIAAKEGEVVAVRGVLAVLDPAAVGEPQTSQHPLVPPAPPSSPKASPAARQAARDNDVDLAAIRGSGDGGRITKDDVLRVAHPPPPQIPDPPPTSPGPPSRPVPAPQQIAQLMNQGGGFAPPIPGVGYGAFKVPQYRPQPGDQVTPFTRRRRITADHMVYSKVTAPHVVTVAEVDLHKASKLREANKDRYKKEGLALTMLAFVVVAAAKAIRETPQINARVLEDAFVIFKDVNIGVAVDSPDGLVVPVVRRADELGVRGIVRAIDDVAKRARDGKITIDDLSGATFSVSNPGLKGNLFGGAIINQPNVGILRMGEIQKRPVVVETDGEDRIAIHPVMYMALSYDHRVVDGVAANAFLWRVTELLEKSDFEV
jgi:2-oxoglutarate dehydrogenase E2 component (dihydrolipoamide succinyltransferase)